MACRASRELDTDEVEEALAHDVPQGRRLLADRGPRLADDGEKSRARTAPGKLEALHARFRNHTMALFQKHGMEVVGFWGPTDKENGSQNTLVYVLAFPSRETRDKAWKDFVADPDWHKARDESEKNGKLLEKIESVILMATDYSPVK
jgi:uncharacterized protein (DUF1330 family)